MIPAPSPPAPLAVVPHAERLDTDALSAPEAAAEAAATEVAGEAPFAGGAEPLLPLGAVEARRVVVFQLSETFETLPPVGHR